MKLAAQVLGAGPPLALVHGWGLGPDVWQDVAPRLAEHFRVHVISLPGYGGSPSAPGELTDLTDLADALAAALPEETTLCGWSLGAMVALACAARHPQRVARLILVAANGRFVRDADWPEAMTADRFAAFAGELDSDAEELLRRFAALVNRGDRAEREATRSLRRGLEDGLPAEAADLRAGLDTLRNAHPAALSAQVSQPTLLIHGAMDPLMPLAGARRLAALLADATLEVDTAAAHAPFLARPQDFVARVLRFAAVAA